MIMRYTEPDNNTTTNDFNPPHESMCSNCPLNPFRDEEEDGVPDYTDSPEK